MTRPKIKKFLKNLHFFSNFLNSFSIFLLILMHIFEKLPQILGLCPIVKFRSTIEKSDPPNIFGTPLNRKILHKLLVHVTFFGFRFFRNLINFELSLRIFIKNLCETRHLVMLLTDCYGLPKIYWSPLESIVFHQEFSYSWI